MFTQKYDTVKKEVMMELNSFTPSDMNFNAQRNIGKKAGPLEPFLC